MWLTLVERGDQIYTRLMWTQTSTLASFKFAVTLQTQIQHLQVGNEFEIMRVTTNNLAPGVDYEENSW